MKEIEFLTLAEIIEIHKNQISLYGGDDGIRDIGLLSSALAIPKSTFNEKFLHSDIYEMAAAYIFHLSQNHPFMDGNKRVALVSGLVFLDFNGIKIDDKKEELYKLMMKVANGNGDKTLIAKMLKRLSR